MTTSHFISCPNQILRMLYVVCIYGAMLSSTCASFDKETNLMSNIFQIHQIGQPIDGADGYQFCFFIFIQWIKLQTEQFSLVYICWAQNSITLNLRTHQQQQQQREKIWFNNFFLDYIIGIWWTMRPMYRKLAQYKCYKLIYNHFYPQNR